MALKGLFYSYSFSLATLHYSYSRWHLHGPMELWPTRCVPRPWGDRDVSPPIRPSKMDWIRGWEDTFKSRYNQSHPSS